MDGRTLTIRRWLIASLGGLYTTLSVGEPI